MLVEVSSEPFNPWARLQAYEATLATQQGDCGAVATFVGNMRDHNEGDDVNAMFLEHYPGMTEQYLQQLAAATQQRWPVLETLIIHRVGHIVPGETIVLTAAWSQHRNAAFEACRHLIEDLKFNAPFWKKEYLTTGQRWVEKNTCG